MSSLILASIMQAVLQLFWKSYMLSCMSYNGNNKGASGSFSAIFTFSGGKFLRVTLVQLYLYQEKIFEAKEPKNQRTKTNDFLYLLTSLLYWYTTGLVCGILPFQLPVGCFGGAKALENPTVEAPRHCSTAFLDGVHWVHSQHDMTGSGGWDWVRSSLVA